jgi:hypothetical protein
MRHLIVHLAIWSENSPSAWGRVRTLLLLKYSDIHIRADCCLIHIGKDANNIDEQPLKITDAQVFRDKRSICEKILSIRQWDAEKIGVKRSALKYIKDGIRKGKKINLKTKATTRLANIVT